MSANSNNRIEEDGLWILALLGLFFLPLKLSLAYICLAPALLWWLARSRGNIFVASKASLFQKLPELFYLFVFAAIITSPFGRDLFRSSEKLLSLFSFTLLMFLFRDGARKFGPYPFLGSLLGGQALASFATALNGSFPEFFPRVFIGQVSESGQLSLVSLAALGVIFEITRNSRLSWSLSYKFILALLFFLSLSIAAFQTRKDLPLILDIGSIAIAITLLVYHLKGSLPFIKGARSYEAKLTPILLFISLYGVALLSNLKRGPWVGAFCGMLAFLLIKARRAALVLILLVVLTITFFDPVKTRLSQSAEDFFISGGRSEIWSVGIDLIQQNPLGIGYANSRVLRNYALNIPKELTHFHNNFLNICVETGWIGIGIFIWWISLLLVASLKASKYPYVSLGLGCGVLSMMVAGSVEYNVGDTEVLYVLFLFAGLISSFHEQDA